MVVLSLLRKWNWKTALLSSVFRALLFLSVNLAAGWRAAAAAMATEFCYRAVGSGFYGALTQYFRTVEPEWKGLALATLLLPALQHSLEAGIHYVRGTPRLAASIGASVAFTAISTAFNLFAMRQGAFLVGTGSQSLGRDLSRLPGIVFAFVAVVPRFVVRQMGARRLV